VAPSDPKSETRTRAVASRCPAALSSSMKRLAARIGPTVWELDGPMPTVKRSTAVRMLTMWFY
jgi:hypothetical protein